MYFNRSYTPEELDGIEIPSGLEYRRELSLFSKETCFITVTIPNPLTWNRYELGAIIPSTDCVTYRLPERIEEEDINRFNEAFRLIIKLVGVEKSIRNKLRTTY